MIAKHRLENGGVALLEEEGEEEKRKEVNEDFWSDLVLVNVHIRVFDVHVNQINERNCTRGPIKLL